MALQKQDEVFLLEKGQQRLDQENKEIKFQCLLNPIIEQVNSFKQNLNELN